jgi:hypothetical protein
MPDRSKCQVQGKRKLGSFKSFKLFKTFKPSPRFKMRASRILSLEGSLKS